MDFRKFLPLMSPALPKLGKSERQGRGQLVSNIKKGRFPFVRPSVRPFRYCVSVTIGAGGPMVGKAHPLGPKAPQGAKPPLEKGGASPPRISSILKF